MISAPLDLPCSASPDRGGEGEAYIALSPSRPGVDAKDSDATGMAREQGCGQHAKRIGLWLWTGN